MRIKQVSKRIWSLESWLVWMIIPVRVWVVVEEDGVTLVDAGLPKMAKGILDFITQLNAGSLNKIVLTHGHMDHVGAVENILKVKEVPVYAHSIEIPYAEGKILYPKRKKLEHNLPNGLIQPLNEIQGVLQKVGGLKPLYTPGHSPGHVAYYHEQDDVLLAGDLFTTRKGRLHQPMALYTGDMKKAVESGVSVINNIKPKKLEVCHGDSLNHPSEDLNSYLLKMEKKLKVNFFLER